MTDTPKHPETLGNLSSRAATWQEATRADPDDWFDFPCMGRPWDHTCDQLQSNELSISVIVPVWNSAASLVDCLSALSLSSLNRLAPQRLQVIVCDDGSTDDSWKQIVDSQADLNLTCLRLPHRNQSAAINAGLAHAEGDVVVCCDSDIVMGCGALDEMAARHERWTHAVTFGFRSNIAAHTVAEASTWQLAHQEAFSGDNRVAFDLPTLTPNMLASNSWLSCLSGGAFMLDSQGDPWRRHRFVYGCLFGARRDMMAECDGFPDVLEGWGFGDTLMAARLEASGGFLLPVLSAWGHHIQHELRHPDQWFQMRRNELAYQHLLAHPPGVAPWRGDTTMPTLDMATSKTVEPGPQEPTPVRWDAVTLHRMGLWEQCLDKLDDGDAAVAAECLYRLGRLGEAAQAGNGRTVWGALSLHRMGDTTKARRALSEAAEVDTNSAYAMTASPPELTRLAQHFLTHHMPEVADDYAAMAAIRQAAAKP